MELLLVVSLYISSVIISIPLTLILVYHKNGQLTLGDLVVVILVGLTPGLNLMGVFINLIFWVDSTKVLDKVIIRK